MGDCGVVEGGTQGYPEDCIEVDGRYQELGVAGFGMGSRKRAHGHQAPAQVERGIVALRQATSSARLGQACSRNRLI